MIKRSRADAIDCVRNEMNNDRIEIVHGSITQQKVGAIVNPANWTLLGGGGVDGAIHHAAGPRLLAECRRLHGCETGQAKVTNGYKLPARHVIHTVGPVWRGGDHGEDELLASCYRECFRLVSERRISTIAFPAISCGSYKFPLERATKIAFDEVRKGLSANPALEKVVFVCLNKEVVEMYQKVQSMSCGEVDARGL